ncbi:MAG: ZIP family metal transporter [Halioglobus sp.]|nr:ZIP family metal transporter [Halioglobus sp.]
MLNAFQWFCLVSILAVTFAGGYYPLFHQDKARDKHAFGYGETFTAGVFLALALTLMLPSSMHLLSKALPNIDFPLGVLFAMVAFMGLLGMEQKINHLRQSLQPGKDELSPPIIPVIMTIMIAIPSFFLGTALGISDTNAAVLIFVAIMMHKSSAALALALKMVRSTMRPGQVWLTFSLFAFATPLGILIGQEIHTWLGSDAMTIIKGVILGLAAGTFLYMATLHELVQAPMINLCNTRKGFSVMLAGFVLTALVRFIMGEAHHLG